MSYLLQIVLQTTLGYMCLFKLWFSQGICPVVGCVCLLGHVRLCTAPWTVVHQTPLPVGFSRQEYWSGVSFTTLGDLSDPGIRHMSLVSPVQAGRFFTTEPPGKAPIPSLLEIFLFLIVIHRCYILSNFFLCQLV